MQQEKDEGLIRSIGIWGLSASIINNVVGAGIFVLPALVFVILGQASIIAYLLCGLLIVLIMLCFAEIGSKITTTGGSSAYIESSFGPWAGFVSNAMYLYGFGVVSDAALANAMLDMLKLSFPILAEPIYRMVFFFILFGGYALINIRGVKQGVNFIKFNTIAKLTPLLLLIVVGIWQINPSNLTWHEWPPVKGLGAASLVLFFAFAGAETSLNTSGEIRNSKRTVPIGTITGILIIVILYILIHLVSLGVLGANLSIYKEAPLAKTAEVLLGKTGSIILISGAIISMFGCIGGSILSFPRLLFASAKSGLAPGFLSKVHAKYSTPFWAIIIYAGLDFILANLGGFSQLAVLASAILLTLYLGVILAALRARLIVKSIGNDFRLPGGISIHLLSIIIVTWFITQIAVKEILGVMVFILVLSAIYYAIKMFKINSTNYEVDKRI